MIDDIFNRAFEEAGSNSLQQTNPESTLSLESSSSVSQSIGNMLISLAFVIMIGLGIAWLMRRYVVKDSNLGGGKIKLVASFALSQKSKVHLIQIGHQTFLVGEGANELNMLSEVDTGTTDIRQLEALASTGTDEPVQHPQNGGFQEKLNQWTSALKSKDMQSEVNTSLLLLGGLAQRLRNKREGRE